MTNIRIMRLVLENFKCHRNLVLTFNGGNTSIYGDNASGKTSIYDALTWLLFGKDSQGNGEKNMEVKPLSSDGTVADHSAITVVEAELDVAGERIQLKRTYREVWSTKRGSDTETFDGNTSEYFVDGVPCKKFAFDERVRQMVPEDIFRLLTSVSYFAEDLPWQKRREVLFQMAGTMSDREILEGAPQFHALLEGMGKLCLEDYKKKLLAEKKGLVGTKTDIPARISECQKTVEDLSGLDFVAAKSRVEQLSGRQTEISAQLAALEHDALADNKRLEIREAKLELDKLEGENQAFRVSQIAGAPDVGSLQNALRNCEAFYDSKQRQLMSEQNAIAVYEKQIEESRTRWIAVHGEMFTGGTCPTCAQQLPMEQLRQATESFEASKQSRLREIERTAESQKRFLAQTQEHIAALHEELCTAQTQVSEARQALEAAQGAQIVLVDMDGYGAQKSAIEARIAALEQELSNIFSGSYETRQQLQLELAEINAQIREANSICGKESALLYAQDRIALLREEAKNASACLEAVEKMLYMIEVYTRHKTRVVEEGVNRLFRIASFRMFREQANGGLEERCDVTVSGVPYSSLNNGMRINVGIDIINALSLFNGVSVPLFVDNAESVTKLECADTQVIRLVVSADDKKLRCEYENP